MSMYTRAEKGFWVWLLILINQPINKSETNIGYWQSGPDYGLGIAIFHIPPVYNASVQGKPIALVWWGYQVVKKFRLYRVGQKKLSHIFLSISSPNIDRFSKFFHLHISWKIYNKLVTTYTTTP